MVSAPHPDEPPANRELRDRVGERRHARRPLMFAGAVAVGAVIGAVIGTATEDVGLWLAIGVGLGSGIGAALPGGRR